MKRLILKKLTGCAVSILLIYLLMPLTSSAGEAQTDEPLVGVWACQSVYGGAYTGWSCQTWPWLKFNADKSYVWGSEQGTWKFKDNVLRLSARKGSGRLNSDGQLIIEYQSKGIQYQQTLYKRN